MIDPSFVGGGEDYVCAICLHLLHAPEETECCGNLFCAACVGESKRQGNRNCPVCREETTFRPVLSVRRRINNLVMVGCPSREIGVESQPSPPTQSGAGAGAGVVVDAKERPHKGRSRAANTRVRRIPQREVAAADVMSSTTTPAPRVRGCLWTGTVADFRSKHGSECPFLHVACPNACGVSDMPRSDLAHHSSVKCPLRPIDCPLCGSRVPDAADPLDRAPERRLAAHQAEACPAVRVPCVGCSDPVARSGQDKHALFQCPEIMRVCGFCGEDSGSRLNTVRQHWPAACPAAPRMCAVCTVMVPSDAMAEHAKLHRVRTRTQVVPTDADVDVGGAGDTSADDGRPPGGASWSSGAGGEYKEGSLDDWGVGDRDHFVDALVAAEEADVGAVGRHPRDPKCPMCGTPFQSGAAIHIMAHTLICERMPLPEVRTASTPDRQLGERRVQADALVDIFGAHDRKSGVRLEVCNQFASWDLLFRAEASRLRPSVVTVTRRNARGRCFIDNLDASEEVHMRLVRTSAVAPNG